MKFFNFLNEKVGLFDTDVDYVIIDAKAPNSYIVTSWITGKSPKNIYIVTNIKGKWSCDCAVHGVCKHINMVKNWLKDGKPNPFLDKSLENDLKNLFKKKGIQTT